MSTPRKFWLVLAGTILAMAVIACSCGSIIPTATATPTTPVNPMPELEGYWLDTETSDVHVIEWQNGQYVVTAVNDAEYGSFAVTNQSWDGSTLSWTYYVDYSDNSVTFTTVSVSGDSLYTNWSNTAGNSGTWTLERVYSPIPAAVTNQEEIPGLAGTWLDPDTSGTYHVIEWQNGEYVVTETQNPSRGGNEIVSSSWENGVLTWMYCVPNAACVTTEAVSVSGDSLFTYWSNDQGSSGSTTLQRMSSGQGIVAPEVAPTTP